MTQDRAPRPGEPLPGVSGASPKASFPDMNGVGTYFLGRYRVVDEIGIGGMASVHLARMDGPGGFQKWVAIKRIHAHLVEDDSFVQMFLDEARVAARISHPNVATVFELGKHDDTYWIAMEYLHGEPLREVMRRTEETGQPMPPEIACRVIADAAEGLHAAHELLGKNGEKLGLVHRDVTPHNLFVTYDGNTKVVDFGIAKFQTRMANTRAGTLKGKLAYMSPEQVSDSGLDRRTDIFALGVVLWELTTGQRLFRMDSDLDTLAKVQECAVPRPSTIVRGYPIDLEKIVMKALAKNRAERFRTAREFSRALQSLLMRRGLFIASDEVANYIQSIFQDRIQKRDAHLRWAAEVTQTINLEQMPDKPQLPESSLVTFNSDVQQAGHPQQQAGYPQQQAGYPQQQTGYPQQQTGYPQQQTGYPQQQAGYPQQQQRPPPRPAAGVPAIAPPRSPPRPVGPPHELQPDSRAQTARPPAAKNAAPPPVLTPVTSHAAAGFVDDGPTVQAHPDANPAAAYAPTAPGTHDDLPTIQALPQSRAALMAAMADDAPMPSTVPRLDDDEDHDDQDDTIVQAMPAEAVQATPLPAAGRPAPNLMKTLPLNGSMERAVPPRPAGRPAAAMPVTPPPPFAQPQAVPAPMPVPAPPSVETLAAPRAMEQAPAVPQAAVAQAAIAQGTFVTPSGATDHRTASSFAYRRRPPAWIVALASAAAVLLVAAIVIGLLTARRPGATPDTPPAPGTSTGGTTSTAPSTMGPFTAARAAFATIITSPGGPGSPGSTPSNTAATAEPPRSGSAEPSRSAAQPPSTPPSTVAPPPVATQPATVAAPATPPRAPAAVPVAPPRRDSSPAAATGTGLLTVICFPACDHVVDNGRDLGASPIFQKQVPAGEHRLKLTTASPPATKILTVIVAADEHKSIKQPMAP